MRLIFALVAFIGIIVWAWRNFRMFSHGPKIEGHNTLTPDVERDARAKFMPSNDKDVDDPSIQPDKRNVKPGDP